MKVKEVMTAGTIKSCNSETKLANAAKMMKDDNLGALPVVDKEKKVVGIITDRDICLSLASKNGKTSEEITVKEILSKGKIHTINAEDELEDVLREMRMSRIGRLPVTDKDGRLKGMISVNNLLSRAITKNEAIGELNAKDENLAKTIKALFDRNNTKAKTGISATA